MDGWRSDHTLFRGKERERERGREKRTLGAKEGGEVGWGRHQWRR